MERIWGLQDLLVDGEGYSPALENAVHRTIRKVSEDIETLKYNTAIAAMMALLNDIADQKQITRGELRTLIILLNPFAPHLTEELWQVCGFEGMVYQQKWPEFDPAKCIEESVEIAVQVSGKLARQGVGSGKLRQRDDAGRCPRAAEVAAAIEGKTIVKEIVVPGKLVNIVAK